MAARRRRARVSTRGSGGVALVLIDVINAFDFPGSRAIVRAATRATTQIERLTARARALDVPVIYVNDNFGQWRSDFKSTVAACTRPDKPGREISARLRPEPGDYFVLKPQHSGFYSTTLDLLLMELGIHTLILVGFATNLCVQFTANDAHMRGYRLVVPSDCTASNSERLTRAALAQIKVALNADVRRASQLDFSALRRNAKKPTGQAF
jgi:nicotinamidase-related amidase